MYVFASVTAGSVNPAAIYVVCTIYTPINNAVPIQYHPHTSPSLSFIHLYSPQTPMLSVTAGHIPPPYMSFVQFTPPPTMLCLYNITPKTSSLMAAIHLFTRSVTKSKISTSPVKKLVAATFGVYMFIHISCLYN